MTEQKYIPIIQPSAQKNGLFFKLGAHPFYEIRKLSIRGRDNGLICIYNMGTKKCSLPGETWRSYKPYYNMELTEIENLINYGFKQKQHEKN